MKFTPIFFLIYFFIASAGAQGQVINYYLDHQPTPTCEVAIDEPKMAAALTSVVDKSDIHDERLKGLESRLGDQTGFFASTIATIAVVLTILSIVVGYLVIKQSTKIDQIYRTYSSKLNELSQNQIDFSKFSVEIEQQRLMIQEVKLSLNLESIHYGAETLLSKVYQLIFKLDRAIENYKEECAAQGGDANHSRCESKKAMANDFMIESRDYCNEAIYKLKHIKDNLWRLKSSSLADEIEMKLKSTWVRAHVASALIYKREWELLKGPSALNSAVSQLKSSLAEADTLSNSIDKARVYFNLACYQSLSGDVEAASLSLERAESYNQRYKLSAKYDKDLEDVFAYRDKKGD